MTAENPTILRTCVRCGKQFFVESYRLNRPNGGKYCSLDCLRHSPKQRISLEERLWQRVDKNGPIPEHHPELGPCWVWTGAKHEWGYGLINVKDQARRTHRLAFEFVYGPIPKGFHVLHACDNPACCRNDDEGFYEVNGVLHPRRGHLWLGTDKDNGEDMVAKGRASHVGPHNAARGENHWMHRRGLIMLNGERRPAPNATITEDQAREIRTRYAAGGVTQKMLAAEFSLNQGTISRIIGGKRWGHIP